MKQNNLKNLDVRIPLGEFTVICGPSGSGKSSLAFETLFAEGQRRFIESMSTYARQFLNKAPKPDIEGVNNIPPAIAIEQKNTIKGSRSTVGTTTELIDYLRLLFEKVGQAYCPTHKIPVAKQSVTDATELTLKHFEKSGAATVRGYVVVELSTKDRLADAKLLHSKLLTDGFLRILVPDSGRGTLFELNDPLLHKKGLPKGDFFLVIDRLSFREAERARIADSLQQAYEASVLYTHQTVRRCQVWGLKEEGKSNEAPESKKQTRSTDSYDKVHFSEELSCPECDYVAPPLTSRLFSFNSPVGACLRCKGFGNTLELDEAKVVPNPRLSLRKGALQPFAMPSAAQEKKALLAYCKKHDIDADVPWQDLPADQRKALWNGAGGFMGVVGLFEMLEEMRYKMHVRVFISRFRSPSLCGDCHGHRLRPESLSVFVHGHNMGEFCEWPLSKLHHFFETTKWTRFETETAAEILKQIRSRLEFLLRVGVHYLTLARETKTLSGGEFQRLMLANQLGMGLSQALFVLDEPTVGLHPRDNDRLISILKDLKDLGNTVVAVEHDHDVIQSADHIIEMGPGSGARGGEILFAGDRKDFFRFAKSNTVPFLVPRSKLAQSKRDDPNLFFERTLRKVSFARGKKSDRALNLVGATGHNLKKVDVQIPLNCLVTVTGVSGSGKSSLISQTLYPALASILDVEHIPALPFQKLQGHEQLKNVVLIDQSAVGRTARSSPVTYLKIFDAIRSLMAGLPESKVRGYLPGTFSLNVDGGRCPTCEGTGVEEIDMMFMDNVVLPCDVCDGKRFRKEILEVTFNGLNISEILKLTVDEALTFFANHTSIKKALLLLKKVGLDYMQLGQSASTLSGGESQRLKIAKELLQSEQASTLYILDEPTTGLHFREVQLLMGVLDQLIEAGGSVILIEHNLDVIRQSDWVLDLGPEGGGGGGSLVASGTVEDILQVEESLTGHYLKKYLEGKLHA